MSTAQHTPGPWNADVDHTTEEAWEAGVQRVQINSPKHLIATYKTEYVEYPSDAENVANARLMAAAPELLAALKLAAQIIGHPEDSASQHIAAVIEKATRGAA